MYGQSKNATCEDYSRGDGSNGSSTSAEMEDVSSLTPLQKGRDGEAQPFFVRLIYNAVSCMQYFTTFFNSIKGDFALE